MLGSHTHPVGLEAAVERHGAGVHAYASAVAGPEGAQELTVAIFRRAQAEMASAAPADLAGLDAVVRRVAVEAAGPQAPAAAEFALTAGGAPPAWLAAAVLDRPVADPWLPDAVRDAAPAPAGPDANWDAVAEPAAVAAIPTYVPRRRHLRTILIAAAVLLGAAGAAYGAAQVLDTQDPGAPAERAQAPAETATPGPSRVLMDENRARSQRSRDAAVDARDADVRSAVRSEIRRATIAARRRRAGGGGGGAASRPAAAAPVRRQVVVPRTNRAPAPPQRQTQRQSQKQTAPQSPEPPSPPPSDDGDPAGRQPPGE